MSIQPLDMIAGEEHRQQARDLLALQRTSGIQLLVEAEDGTHAVPPELSEAVEMMLQKIALGAPFCIDRAR